MLLAYLLLPLSACLGPPSPGEIALQACEAMPGLHVDAVGQQLARGAVLDEEIAIWHDDEDYGPGIHHIGLGGYGVIRANSLCRLESIEGGRATLLRSEPDLDVMLAEDPDALTVFDNEAVHALPKINRPLVFELVEGPAGIRVRLGLAGLRAEAEAARQRSVQSKEAEAIAAFEAIYERFPDPMIRWEIEAVRERAAQRATLDALELELYEDILWAVNVSERALDSGSLTLRCGDILYEHGRPELEPGMRLGLSLDGVGDLTECRLVLP